MRYMKKTIALCAVLMLAIILPACQNIDEVSTSSAAPPDYPLEVGGLTFDAAPQTAVSLSPALTEILCELGYEERLVARGSYSDYPESVLAKTDVGSAANPDIAAITALAPEVLLSQSPITKKDITRLEQAGTLVLILPTATSVESVRHTYSAISAIFGGALGSKSATETAMRPLDDALAAVGDTGVENFVYIMTNDLAVATGDTLSGDILSHFGSNIAAGFEKYAMTTEELTAGNPSLIFLATPINIANLSDAVKALPAAGRVISIDNSSFERPTVRLLTQTVNGIAEQLKALSTADVSVAEETSTSETATVG